MRGGCRPSPLVDERPPSFEGRDGAGKGGIIKAITEHVSPRVFRVVAIPAPTEREKSQIYAQRYLPHLPAAGEAVIFDRSWCTTVARQSAKERPLDRPVVADSGR